MSRTVLRTLVRSALVLATAGVINAGCSRQAEGERCDLEWSGPTQDCDSGLVCTACGVLAFPYNDRDRCCPADGSSTDQACQRASAPQPTTCSTHKISGAAGRAAGTAGTGGTASASTGGTSAAGSGDTGATGGTDSTDMATAGSSGDSATAGNPGQ